MKKIVILYSTSGHGHLNSAKSILQAFKRKSDKVEIRFINILDNGNGFFKFIHFKLYVSLMKYAKWIWGAIYYFSDFPVIDIFVRALRHIVDHKSWNGLEKFLISENPDAIVSTHFFLTSIARSIKYHKMLNAKMYLMVSGYGMHNIWFSKHVDHFFVGIRSVTRELVRRGVSSERVTVTGMPAPEEFIRQYDAVELRKTYGLDPSKKTVFILSGAYGVAPMESMLEVLKDCKGDIQVIVVCGYNQMAYDNINKIKDELGYPVFVFGFTDKIAELMAISDVMISKAGTLSVTQALTMGIPMLIFSYVPGHETPTVKMLVKKGAAKELKNIKQMASMIDKILAEETYNKMKENIDKIRSADSADKMVDIVLKDLGIT